MTKFKCYICNKTEDINSDSLTLRCKKCGFNMLNVEEYYKKRRRRKK